MSKVFLITSTDLKIESIGSFYLSELITLSKKNKFSYTISKSAIEGLINSFIADYSEIGYSINAVLPGVVDSKMTRQNLSEKQISNIESQTPTKNLVYSVNKTTFNCSDLGVNEVELTVTDLEGNPSINTAQVTVEDIIAPTAKSLRSLTYDLNDAFGVVNITPEDINDGSSDNCAIQLMNIDPATFTMTGVYETEYLTNQNQGYKIQ